jgi:hypothetical protein
VVAVFRRGPSQWAQVGRWDLAQNHYEPGAWLRGRIFPRRSDLSPDGRWLCYFAHQPGATWQHGETYIALAKLPWLTALYATGTCGTWTRGYYFTEDGECDHPDHENLPIPYGLRAMPIVQFANERRRGWQESPDSPPRHPQDLWDQRRNAQLQKRQPGGPARLHLESLGRAGGEFGVDQAVDGLRVLYSLEMAGDLAVLEDVQWADWDPTGQLLVATRCGKLQVRQLALDGLKTVFEADLAPLKPAPTPAPAWARTW